MIVFLIILGILAISWFIDWIIFYRKGDLKLSYKKVREMIDKDMIRMSWDIDLFNSYIYYYYYPNDALYGNRCYISLSFIDFWRFRIWAIKRTTSIKKEQKIQKQQKAKKLLKFVEEKHILLDEDRIRKELIDNGFSELTYVGNYSSLSAIYHDCKKDDVISILDADEKDFEIKSFKYYVCEGKTSLNRLDYFAHMNWMPIEKYALKKKKEQDNANNTPPIIEEDIK